MFWNEGFGQLDLFGLVLLCTLLSFVALEAFVPEGKSIITWAHVNSCIFMPFKSCSLRLDVFFYLLINIA